ncbi:cation diffusion facilitator family transporter [Adlercreutzia caecimuris]|uniref:cation diffusion facilitator family transporter n=1 Tax=Adlercreutzia caecimuris TaxID=671266 RepID=UPI0013727216|nr:cation diffusion facilitator family transporter [Adlercreutzia caecimuris]
MNREFEIVKASIYGIVGNLLLVAFKMAVGFASHSIAIILDGVNNATDALSSIITIVGTKLAGRRPDRRHPFGYGRVEYLTSVVIAVIILVAGLISLRESVVKIIHPGTPSYSVLTITVIVVAILAKIFIGIMFKRFGDKTGCEALIASGVDSNYDAVLSAGTLVVAAAQNFWGLNIDGAVGLIISLVVCKAGVEVLRDALAPIIGLPEDKKLVEAIEAYANGFPEVRGTYDVVLDNFGPNEVIGSLHIEVDDDMNAREIHALTRKISEGLAEKFRIMATVGVYAANTTGAFAPMRADLEALAKEDPKILQVHGFYVDDQTKTVYFDMMIDFHADDDAIRTQVTEAMKKKYPAYTYNVVVDTDYED